MPLHLHSIRGDLLAEAPQHCQLAVYWVRGGFNPAHPQWMKVSQQYKQMVLLPAEPQTRKPWQRPNGATFELTPGDDQLRHIHVLPKPADAHGYPSLLAVGAAVAGALDVARGLNVQKVGFIHLPVHHGGQEQAVPVDDWGASAMIGAIGAWDAIHPDTITDVFLFDLEGDFDRFVNLPPPVPSPPPLNPPLPE